MGLLKKQKNEFRASLHNHSSFSGYGYSRDCTLENMIQRAFEDKLDLLVVTDNSEDKAFDYIKNNHKEFEDYQIYDLGNNILVIEKDNKLLYFSRGIEFRENIGGHLLAIGHNKKIQNFEKYSIQDLIKLIHDYSGSAILSHPLATEIYHIKLGGIGEEKLLEIKDEIDAIEVFNAANTCFIPVLLDRRKFNEQAKEFAREYQLAKICAPDSRRVKDIAVCYMSFPKNKIDFSDGERFVSSINYLIGLTKNENIYQKFAHERYSSWLSFVEVDILPRLHKNPVSLYKELFQR